MSSRSEEEEEEEERFDRPEMYRLRVVEGMTLRQIGARYGISGELVRQLLRPYVRAVIGEAEADVMTSDAARRRNELKLTREHAQADAILQAWRAGEAPEAIAKRLAVRQRSVTKIIAAYASEQDRSARVRAHRQAARQRTPPSAAASLPLAHAIPAHTPTARRARGRAAPVDELTGSRAGMRWRGHLPAPVERRLLGEAQAGDARARARLVEEFLPLIERVARDCPNARQLTHDELVQEGVVGLLRALDRHDPTLAVAFWGYAFWWVLQAMRQLIGELAHPVALPGHALDDLSRVEQAYSRLQCAGYEVTLSALSAETGLAATALASLIAAGCPPQALEQQIRDADGERTAFGEQIADPLAEEDYEKIVIAVTASQLRHLLGGLSDREQAIVKARYGLDAEPETLRQIGARLGITRERVRQIHVVALKRLQIDAIRQRS